jgi:hypothetical protein
MFFGTKQQQKPTIDVMALRRRFVDRLDELLRDHTDLGDLERAAVLEQRAQSLRGHWAITAPLR